MLNYKGLLIFGIVLIDIFIILSIINYIGIKNFGRFFLGYIFMLFMAAFLFGILGKLDPKEWELDYNKKFKKKQNKYFFRLSILIVFLISCLLTIRFFIHPYMIGMIAGFGVIWGMAYYGKDILHIIDLFRASFEGILLEKYKWLK